MSSDGRAGAGNPTTTVTRDGLTWTLVKHENARSEDGKVWQATAEDPVSNVT